jgi:hypothetical protein
MSEPAAVGRGIDGQPRLDERHGTGQRVNAVLIAAHLDEQLAAGHIGAEQHLLHAAGAPGRILVTVLRAVGRPVGAVERYLELVRIGRHSDRRDRRTERVRRQREERWVLGELQQRLIVGGARLVLEFDDPSAEHRHLGRPHRQHGAERHRARQRHTYDVLHVSPLPAPITAEIDQQSLSAFGGAPQDSLPRHKSANGPK